MSGEGNGAANHSTGCLHGLHNLLGRLVDEIVVERFEFDANFLANIGVLFCLLFEKVNTALTFGEYVFSDSVRNLSVVRECHCAGSTT